jgi:hypothetical protein
MRLVEFARYTGGTKNGDVRRLVGDQVRPPKARVPRNGAALAASQLCVHEPHVRVILPTLRDSYFISHGLKTDACKEASLRPSDPRRLNLRGGEVENRQEKAFGATPAEP